MHNITALFSRATLCQLVLLLVCVNAAAKEALTLTDALKKSITHHPSLQSYPYEVRMLDASLLQASIRPSPKLGVKLENILGTGESKGVKSAELTLSLSQVIELGDKRQLRMALQQQKQQYSTAQYQSDRLSVLTDTAGRYYQVLYQQHLLKWHLKRETNTQKLLNVVEARAKAGAALKADVSRVAYRLTELKLNKIRIQRDLAMAKFSLSKMWLAAADFDQVLGDISDLPVIPSETIWHKAVNRAPDFVLLEQQVKIQQAQLAVEQANNVANITLEGGVRHNAGNHDSGVVLGFSMPLTWQKPNRGNIALAQEKIGQLSEEQALLRQSLRSQLSDLHTQMLANKTIERTLQSELLPHAKQLLQHSEASYQNGQISVLQLLEAQEALFDAEKQLLTVRLVQFQTLLTMQRFSGKSLINDTASE
ncbi:TolC family protein [Thalassotalea sp. 1_MG-2023]|uniref:TolC family protein n=1 Tax=Thalassotalea sp. 1_MG-2023 TaxID=3062680 RepID=UPI0026E13F57|nr:TolC family protein [Thalassotalea sp. 1_MG-2023]MDO6425874.1 TolC family protein [Thalassotalea sp. 1_MG-2023]